MLCSIKYILKVVDIKIAMTNKLHQDSESVGREHEDEKTNDALLDVTIEADTNPFIYDVDETPPLVMTIFFAMQVKTYFVFIN